MNTTNILITGANGQLGHEMRNVLNGDMRFNAVFTDVAGDDILPLDITDEDAVERMVSDNAIHVIVNCAAYTAVDAAEDNEPLAARLNTDAVGILALVAKRHVARMVHISTDYVFDGKGCVPYTEDMPTSPQSAYGRTKLDGECQLLETLGDGAVILRTAWLYSPYGNNFVKTMLRLGKERQQLGVVVDQIGTPTYAHDLAQAITTIIEKGIQPGIFNFTDEGVCSWYDFACAIHHLAGIDSCKVNPIRTEDYPTPAHRPHFSVLDKSKIKQTFGIDIPHWHDALVQCIDRLTK